MDRVLVVLPFYGGSLPIGRYVAKALEDVGCLVRVFEAPGFYGAFSALSELKVTMARQEYLENSYLQLVSQAILAQVETFEPNLVLCLAQAPMTRQALKRLRKDQVATAMWFVEDHRLFAYWSAYAPLYDVFAVIQKDDFFGKLKEIGAENPLYLPLAALPELHRPTPLTPEERKTYGADISFLGAGYPNRRVMFLDFLKYDFKIWGTEWEGAERLLPRVQMNGRRIPPEEAVKIYNAAKINLNLHSSVKAGRHVGHGDFVNPRTFELAACGAFQLTDKRSLMPELFAEGELALFETPEQLLEMTDYFLERPDERESFAQKARARVLADHTYQHRMRTLLDFVRAKIPYFSRGSGAVSGNLAGPGGSDFPEQLTPELAARISSLLKDMCLPADCSFEDLTAAVRERQGKLTDLESALLFLDEWRKLYRKG